MDAELALFEAEIQKLSAAVPAGDTDAAGGAAAAPAAQAASTAPRTVPIGVRPPLAACCLQYGVLIDAAAVATVVCVGYRWIRAS